MDRAPDQNPAHAPQPSPLRVLIVDDEVSLVATLAANLQLEGFDVFEATNGPDALSIVQKNSIDLVLTDIRMPGMSGVDLFYELRKLRHELPVVLMTAFAAQGLAERALGDGAFALLSKPFVVEHVTATLLRAARRPVVLIVDGDEADRIAGALRAHGIRAEACTNDELSLAPLREGSVDVCVIPLVSDESDTSALLRALAESESAISVIVIAGRRLPNLVKRMSELRPFAMVRDPADIDLLARLIAKARGTFGHSSVITTGAPES